MSEIVKSLLPIIVTVLAGLIAYWRYRVEVSQRQETLLNALFGELGNILEHYTYAAYELSNTSCQELEKRLRWSKYGQTHFSDDVSRYGFLTPSEIQKLLQLKLRIRNNDHLCDMYLQDLNKTNCVCDSHELETLRARMVYIMKSTSSLLISVTEKNSILRKTLHSVMADLPNVEKQEE